MVLSRAPMDDQDKGEPNRAELMWRGVASESGSKSDRDFLTYEPCLLEGKRMPLRSMQVTIALLPVSLSLVHIPRSRLDSLSHPILRQLLHPNPAFLNITCNEIELSLFAENHNLEDLKQIARKDRQRSRSGSASSRKSTSQHAPVFEPVEISCENWSVLQIDSHSDQIDNSGTRVYDLSAPLAAAGISILYQSSYTSDFIFVKESRLQETMDIFTSSGFDLYTAESNSSTSPLYSPVTDDRVSSDFASTSCQNKGAVFTRNINEAGSKRSNSPSSKTSQTSQQPPRTTSHSPTTGEVRMLSPDLACVGLSDDLGVDHWGLKIIKLVAFPDLIPSPRATHAPSHPIPKKLVHGTHPISYTRQHPAVDISLVADIYLTRSTASSDSSSTSSDGDGYFSHSPQNVSTTSLTTNTSRSCTDVSSLGYTSSGYKSPSKHFVAANISPLSPVNSDGQPSLPPLSVVTDSMRSIASPSCSPRIPFFSFTRTPEGSSLTADVTVLATLFPPKERHMVICSGELDAADLRMQQGLDGDILYSSDEDEDVLDNISNMNGDYSNRSRTRSRSNDTSSGTGGSYKCLQIDLRRFGLDKYGLVNRFSRVLEENGINHMYSSTFKTANLLVDKKDAIRAQSLLRSC